MTMVGICAYMWNVIAPMVLEEAAKVCDQSAADVRGTTGAVGASDAIETATAEILAERIRALGKP